eukprot:TRINITY_DN15717_c0_g1_i1.p2 TRINITY_DN15717_c0_g1~~TRINITY_DN15717_c0_g1_i1.p2  ORF type:complete len:100 (-),score=22.67 TRINITY_DN15717_c0_g1_i1:21-320(-)
MRGRQSRSTLSSSSAASDVYKRQYQRRVHGVNIVGAQQLIKQFPNAVLLYLANTSKKSLEEELQKKKIVQEQIEKLVGCLLYTSPSPRDRRKSRMPSSA